MGKRGPAKTPTNILRMRGSWLADTRKAEPQARQGVPSCPAFLAGDDLAEQVWSDACNELAVMGILSTADGVTLGAYCEVVAEYQRLAKRSREVLADGGDIPKQLIDVKNKARADLLRYAAHFGLTPSARASIDLGNKSGGGDEDEKNFAAG